MDESYRKLTVKKGDGGKPLEPPSVLIGLIVMSLVGLILAVLFNLGVAWLENYFG